MFQALWVLSIIKCLFNGWHLWVLTKPFISVWCSFVRWVWFFLNFFILTYCVSSKEALWSFSVFLDNITEIKSDFKRLLMVFLAFHWFGLGLWGTQLGHLVPQLHCLPCVCLPWWQCVFTLISVWFKTLFHFHPWHLTMLGWAWQTNSFPANCSV